MYEVNKPPASLLDVVLIQPAGGASSLPRCVALHRGYCSLTVCEVTSPPGPARQGAEAPVRERA